MRFTTEDGQRVDAYLRHLLCCTCSFPWTWRYTVNAPTTNLLVLLGTFLRTRRESKHRGIATVARNVQCTTKLLRAIEEGIAPYDAILIFDLFEELGVSAQDVIAIASRCGALDGPLQFEFKALVFAMTEASRGNEGTRVWPAHMTVEEVAAALQTRPPTKPAREIHGPRIGRCPMCRVGLMNRMGSGSRCGTCGYEDQPPQPRPPPRHRKSHI